MSEKNATVSISDIKDLITFLGNESVSSFEGFGIKLIFNASRQATSTNPFEIQDEATRKAALLANFKAMASTPSITEEDLMWSTNT